MTEFWGKKKNPKQKTVLLSIFSFYIMLFLREWHEGMRKSIVHQVVETLTQSSRLLKLSGSKWKMYIICPSEYVKILYDNSLTHNNSNHTWHYNFVSDLLTELYQAKFVEG